MTGTTLDGMLLASTDPDRLRDWYVDALAPEKVQQFDQYRILQFGSFGLVIDERTDVATTNPDPARVILNFGVKDAKAVTAHLDQMGVTWVAELEDRDGSLFATAKDPDGQLRPDHPDERGNQGSHVAHLRVRPTGGPGRTPTRRCAARLASPAMPSRLSLVKKAAAKVLEAGEQLEAACMVSLPGTLKREGRQAALRGALGIRVVDIGDDDFPDKLIAATTDRRVLLFEQSMFGRAKQLVAGFPLTDVAAIEPTGTSRAQVSLKLLNFSISLRDGNELALESADRKGAEELIASAQARLGTSSQQ